MEAKIACCSSSSSKSSHSERKSSNVRTILLAMHQTPKNISIHYAWWKCVGLSYCLHIWWLDDVSPFKEHSEECFTFMDHALLLFIVFFSSSLPHDNHIQVRMYRRNWMLSFREFPTHPWKCCHQLKDFFSTSCCGSVSTWLQHICLFIDIFFMVNWVLTAFKTYSNENEWDLEMGKFVVFYSKNFL